MTGPPSTVNKRTANKRAAERRGRGAEWLAAAILMAKGYRILARRYRNGAGEIDLIARKRGLVAYVEVKYRARRAAAPFAVAERQKQRIRRAAALFLAHNPSLAAFDQRFDVLVVSRFSLPQHIKNAW
ncbi:MAG: YraN family protein [Alphaproteobacteria bacterium]|nr:MAG: YraN family protein [Alphaproteobacteria bacterium]